MYFCNILMEIHLNIGQDDFLANVRMVKFGSELRFGIQSPNVRTPFDITSVNKGSDQLHGDLNQHLCFHYTDSKSLFFLNPNFKPTSVPVQPGLCRAWSETMLVFS